MYYNESNDQSEKFGWKKCCDEHVPTEGEQIYWSKVSIIAAVVLALPVFL
jgi:hypothetical protein